MQSMLSFLRSVYQRLVPESARRSPFMERLKTWLLTHNAIYHADYYAEVDEAAVRSAGAMTESIVTQFKPRRVVDVGCGTGALLEAFRQRGCEVYGLEYSEAALQFCRARKLRVEQFDLEHDSLGKPETFDVATSMEVAEHLPEKFADRYVDLLTQMSNIVVLTAAHPGQGGTDHVNEQPPSYWIAKFQARGFTHDAALSRQWGQVWKEAGNVSPWYCENLMVFQRLKK